MPGGSEASYEKLGPIFEQISAHVDGEPCCMHVGPGAAGHFVKMVHNGIEYADMQLIAEAYDLMREIAGASPEQLAGIFGEWNKGDLESFLIELTMQVLAHRDAETGQPFVDIIEDQAEQKGTGRWTVQSALDLGVPVTGIAEATFARSLSGHAEQRVVARDTFGGEVNPQQVDAEEFIEDVRQALYASKIIAYAQGFDQIRTASEENDWAIDLGRVATIWRGGCIIRARFLNRIREAYDDQPELPTLLAAPYFADAIKECVDSWRRVVADGGRGRCAGPGLRLIACLLRRVTPGAPARFTHPGPARQLRRPHLPTDRQGGQLPHAVGRGDTTRGCRRRLRAICPSRRGRRTACASPRAACRRTRPCRVS